MTRTAFTRAEPDERRASLIAATATVLAELGAAGVSVRAISAEAGVSPGLLRHYFDGIDALIAETYRAVGERVSNALAEAVEGAGTDPRARLAAYVTASFRAPIADPGLLATWTAFWSLARSNAEIAALHGEVYGGYREELEALLRDCGMTEGQVRLAAVAMTALVDGLWLELCLAPEAFTAEEASGIAERYLDMLLG